MDPDRYGMGIAADAVRRRIQASSGQMVKGAAKTAAQAVTGGLIDPTVRLDTCHQCEHLLPTQRCALCGCYMPGKARVKLAKCPDGRW